MTGDCALGLVETYGLIAGIKAADAMVKAAAVRLVDRELTTGRLVTIKIVGETGAVRAAVSAGVEAANSVGRVVSSHVIPRPHEDVEGLIHSSEPRSQPEQGGFEALTVAELRRRVRAISGTGLSGRDISRASKAELLTVLRRQTT